MTSDLVRLLPVLAPEHGPGRDLRITDGKAFRDQVIPRLHYRTRCRPHLVRDPRKRTLREPARALCRRPVACSSRPTKSNKCKTQKHSSESRVASKPPCYQESMYV